MESSFRFDKFFLHRLLALCTLQFAAGATPLTGGGGGTPPAGGAGAGSGTGSGGGTGTGTGTGVPSAQSGAQGGSPSSGAGGQGATQLNWADAPQQFREAYDTLKAQHEPWGKLAEELKLDHSVVGTQVRNFQTLVNEAYDLGEKAGYSEEQIRTALQKNMVGTLHWLRSRTGTPGAGGQGAGRTGQGGQQDQGPDAIQKAIEKALKPYQDDLTTRQVQAANQAFDNTCIGLMKTAYGESYSSMPDPVRNLLLDAATELFKYDEAAGRELFAGKTAGIQKFFDQAKTIIEGAFISWQQWQQKSATGAGGQGGQGGGKPNAGGGRQQNTPPEYKGNFLDDLATGNDDAFAELGRRRKASIG